MKDALTYANEAGFFSFNVIGWKAEFERLIEAVRADALAELATVKESLTAQDHFADNGNKVPDHIADAGKVIMLTAGAAQQIDESLLRVEQSAEECEGDDGMVMVVPLDLYNELAESLETIRAARAQEQAEQGPVAIGWQRRNKYLPAAAGKTAEWEQCFSEEATDMFSRNPRYEYRKIYAAPVRTKDLTDEEIEDAVGWTMTEQSILDCRAVIAKFKEKNRV